tara:strand:+ start:1960 stop:3357 length:1398 start_codon:yes stop_codon:yes gene_type:complete
MSSCNNSSNLVGNVNVNNITHSGARLLMTHPLSGFSGGKISQYQGDDGITAGDAIRFNTVDYHATSNPSGGKYVKAQADLAHTSEVVGVVESVEGVNTNGTAKTDAVVNVVISGQIKYPTDKLLSATHIYDFDADDTLLIEGASGGNDIYFLSEVTAGAVQNLAPITPTTIAKPILQRADDGDFTAQVVNYIGYQIGGEVVGTDEDYDAGGSYYTALNMGGGETILPPGNILISGSGSWLSINDEDLGYRIGQDTYYTAYNRVFNRGVLGRRWSCKTSTSPSSTNLNQTVTTKNSNGTTKFSGKVVSIDVQNNILYIETTNMEDIINGEILYTRRNERLTVSDALPVAFFTGSVPQKQTQVTDWNGVRKTIKEDVILKMKQDLNPQSRNNPQLEYKGPGVFVARELTVTKLNVLDELKAGSKSDGKNITDVVKAIRMHNDSLTTIENHVHKVSGVAQGSVPIKDK